MSIDTLLVDLRCLPTDEHEFDAYWPIEEVCLETDSSFLVSVLPRSGGKWELIVYFPGAPAGLAYQKGKYVH